MTLQDPVIINLTEQPSELSGLADVLIGSFGLAGAVTLLALVAGIAMAALLFWWRSRSQP